MQMFAQADHDSAPACDSDSDCSQGADFGTPVEPPTKTNVVALQCSRTVNPTVAVVSTHSDSAVRCGAAVVATDKNLNWSVMPPRVEVLVAAAVAAVAVGTAHASGLLEWMWRIARPETTVKFAKVAAGRGLRF